MNIWFPKSISPSFKVAVGYSASGNVLTKSVSIRNVDPECLTNTGKKGMLDNIINSIADTPDVFTGYIAKIVVSASYEIERE